MRAAAREVGSRARAAILLMLRPEPSYHSIQRDVLTSMYEHCPVAARAAIGLHLETIGDVLVSIAEHDPSVLLNRAHGLGSREPVMQVTIDAVAARYRNRGIARFFLHVYPQTLPAEGGAWLREAGLEKARGWVQFARGTAPVSPVRTDLVIRRVDARRAADFARIACRGFGLRPVCQAYLAALLGDSGSSVYMSFDGDVPAGIGVLFVRDRGAYLGFGATDPAYRRRGSQGAIMAARVQAALDAGCSSLYTETGEAVAGEDQPSYRNILRCGFAPVAVCENWTPAAGTAGSPSRMQ